MEKWDASMPSISINAGKENITGGMVGASLNAVSYTSNGTYPKCKLHFPRTPPQKTGGASKMYHYMFEVYLILIAKN